MDSDDDDSDDVSDDVDEHASGLVDRGVLGDADEVVLLKTRVRVWRCSVLMVMVCFAGQEVRETASTMRVTSNGSPQSSASECTCSRPFSRRTKRLRVASRVRTRRVATSGRRWVWRSSGCFDGDESFLVLEEVELGGDAEGEVLGVHEVEAQLEAGDTAEKMEDEDEDGRCWWVSAGMVTVAMI